MAANVVVDGEEEFGFVNGFLFVDVGIEEIFDYASAVGAARLFVAEMAEAGSVFPFANGSHGPHVVSEFFVRVTKS